MAKPLRRQYDAKSFGNTFFPNPAANYQSIIELEKRLAATTQALEKAGIVVPPADDVTSASVAALSGQPASSSSSATRPSRTPAGEAALTPALLPTSTTGGDEQSGASPPAKNGSPPTVYYPERAEERTSTASAVADRLRRRTRSQLLSGRREGGDLAHNYGAVQGTAPRAPLIDREHVRPGETRHHGRVLLG